MSGKADQQLFMIYIGGMVPGCNVELHDVRFAVGGRIEDCYKELARQWWGTPESLHLDCWGAVTWADGHDVSLREAPAEGEQKLWFVNLGGYDPAQFTELHENLLVVAEDERAAKKRALERIEGWFSPHKDNVLEVETIFSVGDTLEGLHVHLVLSTNPRDFAFEARYVPIGKMMA